MPNKITFDSTAHEAKAQLAQICHQIVQSVEGKSFTVEYDKSGDARCLLVTIQEPVPEDVVLSIESVSTGPYEATGPIVVDSPVSDEPEDPTDIQSEQ